MAMFVKFQQGELPLFHLNFGTITLPSNKKRIQYYPPIYVLNTNFKISTKVGTNNITGIAYKVIRPTQMGFMLGRHIIEGVVVLHEMTYEFHQRKNDGILLKIDFEEARDKVMWPFL